MRLCPRGGCGKIVMALGCSPSVPRQPGGCVWSLLVLVEAGQQAEGALEYLGCDEAGSQASFDLQADQHRLPDGPGLDGCDPGGEVAAFGIISVGELLEAAFASGAVALQCVRARSSAAKNSRYIASSAVSAGSSAAATRPNAARRSRSGCEVSFRVAE